MDPLNVPKRHRLLIRCTVSAALLFICSFRVYGQAVTFPTDGNCFNILTAIPTPGGFAYFTSGVFFSHQGVPTLTTCYSSSISMLFSPAASTVAFSITNFYPINQQIWVDAPAGRVTYLIPPGGTQSVNIQGANIASISVGSVDFHLGVYGITGLSVEQPLPNIGFVQFDLSSAAPATSDQAKVLLSKAAWDIGYPSSLQLAPDNAGNPQVKIAGTRIDAFSGQPASGTVYLKITDPPDTAPYRNGDATNGDNDGALAKLGSGGLTASVQADQQGRFETTLIINSRTAGDNYQIVGSTNENFDCGASSCARSAIFTLWKRVYVEEEHMFRKGSFIRALTPAGTNTIPIADPSPFRTLTSGATLRLLHADASGSGFYAESAQFKSLSQDSAGNWQVETIGQGEGSGLLHDYGAASDPTHPTSAGTTTISSVLRDAVGIEDSGFYVPDASGVAGLLRSAYVEVRPAVPGAITELPYVKELSSSQVIYFAGRWAQNIRPATGIVKHLLPNVLHRIGISQTPLVSDQNTGKFGAEIGLTSAAGDTNWSAVMVQRIEDVSAGRVIDTALHRVGAEYFGLDPGSINFETTAHETIHWWMKEPLGADKKGHCLAQRYQHDGVNCLMHTPYSGRGLADRELDMHYEQHGADSEYMTVRRAADPVPQP